MAKEALQGFGKTVRAKVILVSDLSAASEDGIALVGIVGDLVADLPQTKGEMPLLAQQGGEPLASGAGRLDVMVVLGLDRAPEDAGRAHEKTVPANGVLGENQVLNVRGLAGEWSGIPPCSPGRESVKEEVPEIRRGLRVVEELTKVGENVVPVGLRLRALAAKGVFEIFVLGCAARACGGLPLAAFEEHVVVTTEF